MTANRSRRFVAAFIQRQYEIFNIPFETPKENYWTFQPADQFNLNAAVYNHCIYDIMYPNELNSFSQQVMGSITDYLL